MYIAVTDPDVLLVCNYYHTLGPDLFLGIDLFARLFAHVHDIEVLSLERMVQLGR
jgi:hypothetical protein